MQTKYAQTTADIPVELSVNEFLDIYSRDSLVKYAIEKIFTDNRSHKIHLKGLSGSLDAIISAVVCSYRLCNHLFVLHDKEEASYFYHDLQSLLPHKNDVLFFPTSYKKPYRFTQIENANVLQRAEALNHLNKGKKGKLIVTYPEALTEKVINRRALLKHSLALKKGEQPGVDFVSEVLTEYGFEKTGFAYEAGQFAVRGGIVDIFSYANEYPYRIEFFDDQIESIRTFDPLTQLSITVLDYAAIIPDIQTELQQETRESFFHFFSGDSKIWLKDISLTIDIIEKQFNKAREHFREIITKSKNTQIVSNPEHLFETPSGFLENLENYRTIIEFGKRFYFDKQAFTIEFSSQPQPSFHKNFELLADALEKNQRSDIENIIVSDSPHQLMRVATIFKEINPALSLKELHLSLSSGFYDKNVKIACYTDHQIFERYFRYKSKQRFTKSKAVTLKELQVLQVGDYVTHVDYGIARFGGLEKITVGEREQEAIRLIFRDNDLLYISVHALHKLSKYTGKDGRVPNINKLGSQEWEQKKKKTKSKIKDIAKDLIRLYAKRKASRGFQSSPDSYLQAELESSFIYEETPDQAEAIRKTKADMEQAYPMDRLICGDVGFGKTEVAIRAAFKSVCNSKQVAVLVPTTLLAYQHYVTFTERLKNLPCEVAYINRFKTAKEIREITKKLKEGKLDILIGTHKMLGKDIQFKDLGLLIIDEEQKFGVKTKEKLKALKVNIDTLTLTATPIPRTLHFSLMGARDLSIITTSPSNRQPVSTEVHTYDKAIIRDAIYNELQRNGQVFFVHNRVHDIIEMTDTILRLVPDAKVAYAHGQMEGRRLEKVMMKFVAGEYDVLVSTNIIESGLDIANANTIIINHAHTFGLSDLHQMRGRVGRSNKKAYCHLLAPPTSTLAVDTRKRLSTLEEFSDLGDGFKIAMRDLDIRGAGNILGGEQSGFISDLGFDMYNKILEDAVKELKEEEFKELFNSEENAELQNLQPDCHIETDFEILIPEDYITDISERLKVYVQADEIQNEVALEKFEKDLKDRFGPIPRPVKYLLKSIEMRWLAQALGIEKLILKNNTLKASLPDKDKEQYYQSDIFGKVIDFVRRYPNRCQLKEIGKRLIFMIEDITSVDDAIKYLSKIKT